MNIKDRVKRIKSTIPILYFSLKDKRTPFIAKIMAGITVFYALSPIDLVPDFVPVLGYLDDLFVIPLLTFITIKLIPNNILEKYKNHKDESIATRWYYAIPTVLIWILVIFFIYNLIKYN